MTSMHPPQAGLQPLRLSRSRFGSARSTCWPFDPRRPQALTRCLTAVRDSDVALPPHPMLRQCGVAATVLMWRCRGCRAATRRPPNMQNHDAVAHPEPESVQSWPLQNHGHSRMRPEPEGDSERDSEPRLLATVGTDDSAPHLLATVQVSVEPIQLVGPCLRLTSVLFREPLCAGTGKLAPAWKGIQGAISRRASSTLWP
jgi:hypothetical protein